MFELFYFSKSTFSLVFMILSLPSPSLVIWLKMYWYKKDFVLWDKNYWDVLLLKNWSTEINDRVDSWRYFILAELFPFIKNLLSYNQIQMRDKLLLFNALNW